MAMNSRWAQARNILAVRLDNMGDVLMTSPALRALHSGHPQARVTLLTSAAGAQAARRIKAVDRTLIYDAPWSGGPGSQSRSAQTDLRLIETLARHQFDAAVVFTVCTQSALPAALTCRLAGIPLRLAHARENPYALLSDWVPETDTAIAVARHEVQRQLDLVRHVGFETRDERLQLQYSAQDVQRMRETMAAFGGDASRPYLVVHPGASAASRRYPAAAFGRAAAQLQAHTGMQIIFSGARDEIGLAIEATAQMPQMPVNLMGHLSLGELAALIAGARALVCNNTGPAHIAAALQTPVVVLYALTNPQHTPWQSPSRVLSHDVPCRNCLKSLCPQLHHHCLELIEPQRVVHAVLDLLGLPVPAPMSSVAQPLPSRAHAPLITTPMPALLRGIP